MKLTVVLAPLLSLFAGTIPPDQVRTIAHDNGGDELSLVGMTPGVYTLIDFAPGPDGRPHALHGQTAQLTIGC